MRHKLEIERRVSTKDAAGQPLGEWQLLHRCRAALKRTAGAEVVAADQRNARVPTVFRIRFAPLVLAKMRLRLVSANPVGIFDIVSAIDPEGRQEVTEITAIEHVEEAVEQ